MKLEVFERYSRQRVNLIKTHSFVQYTDSFNSVGTFTLLIPLTEESLKDLQIGNYILFEDDICGEIEYRYKSESDQSSVTIRGKLIKNLLNARVFSTQKTYSGTMTSIAREMVTDLLLIPDNEKRTVAHVRLSDNSLYNPATDTITKSVLGEELQEGIDTMLAVDSLGSDLVPILANYDEVSGKEANISYFEFRVLKGADRSISNTEGNVPVVFSIELNNLRDYYYEQDYTEYKNVATVEGKDEGENLLLIDVGDVEAVGIDRKEVYVDAIDYKNFHTGTEEGLTEEQYLELLQQKGKERLEDYKPVDVFSGTVLPVNFVYGVDFFKGDWVSLLDASLGVIIRVQITGVTKSLTTVNEVLDFTFGYERATVEKRLKKRGVL